MPHVNIRRCVGMFSAKRCFETVRLINRYALLLGPLLLATFAIVADWIASDYGAQYLFRDNERLDHFGLCDPDYPASGNRHASTARLTPPRSWGLCGPYSS